jgi:hypothetical protein
MNVRDPFNLHRSSAYDILRGTARQAAANVTQRVREGAVQAIESGSRAYETGKQTLEDMSFSIPKNVPSFTDPQRDLENRVWGSTSGITARPHANGGVISGVQDRVGTFFGENSRDLPMYKDKPYSYVSRRRQPLWRRKRTLGIGGAFLLFVLYLLGFFGNDAAADTKTINSWTWLQKPEKGASKTNWLGRRERVVEAFTLSWDAYDRYAWGRPIFL